METTLHRQLKQLYATDLTQTEVVMGDYRIDAVRDDELIEIQCASLAAISAKATQLLRCHRLRVVKPIIARTRIAKKTRSGGAVVSRRLSPKRGDVLDLFDELIYFTRVFPHENLVVEVPMIHVEQTRVPNAKKRRRSWHKDYRVLDVSLESIEKTYELRVPSDLLKLANLSQACVSDADAFDTSQIAAATERPRWFAQKIAYVLRKTNAIEATGRTKSGITYRKSA
ncbi:hypothetical protein [Stieleria varia]|uniref:DUF8091 domain-containing protein n=1 Tax=Stieleria varia TaxID=2528005 RepID=A0A5C6AG35_9BACT|nr:hypothetical protein [Stieleria varia]TWT98420.1 hypothetical protein Pla52n_49330 [Stieleria varia]